ncbi:MAG TPA: hypothetical protein VMT38_12675 [Terracidiphilus sp.]|nr:hypothetical protein [Terracidiphilus sp.]
MGVLPILWAVWGLSFVFMAGVTIFAARLGRNEEAQIFLADSSQHQESDQAAIAERVGRIRPVKTAAWVLVGVMTAVVVAYYAIDIIHQF